MLSVTWAGSRTCMHRMIVDDRAQQPRIVTKTANDRHIAGGGGGEARIARCNAALETNEIGNAVD